MLRLKRFFLTASLQKACGETLLLFFLLILFTVMIYQTSAVQMSSMSLTFFVNPCCALYYSLRLQIPGGRWYRRIGVDVLWLAVPALFFNLLVWLIIRSVLLDLASYGSDIQLVDFIFIVLLAFPYLFFRVTTRFIVWWNDLRQRRMIWALVSSNLIAVALLQLLVAMPIAVWFFSSLGNNSFMQIPDNPLAQLFYRVQLSLPLIGLGMLAATAVLIALLPVSIAVSYFFATGIRQRLDALLDAAHAARDGKYDIRILVTGRDEIGRLQADFNQMTENLKINIEDLHNEREKVAALLRTRRELMANVSHELRTPIATVSAYLESMLRQPDTTISQKDLLIIQRETLRLQTLIDDLFALSRAEVDQLALTLIPLDSVVLIQRVIATVAPLAWRINRVEIISKLPDRLPNIIADESRLEQVLRNLIHNSLKYTPPGGLIILSAAKANACVEIQVQDTGEGIAPEHLPHIWERYYRDSENGGTGLGLALVKSFIEAMNGSVTVTSTPGEGTCIVIRLPHD